MNHLAGKPFIPKPSNSAGTFNLKRKASTDESQTQLSRAWMAPCFSHCVSVAFLEWALEFLVSHCPNAQQTAGCNFPPDSSPVTRCWSNSHLSLDNALFHCGILEQRMENVLAHAVSWWTCLHESHEMFPLTCAVPLCLVWISLRGTLQPTVGQQWISIT